MRNFFSKTLGDPKNWLPLPLIGLLLVCATTARGQDEEGEALSLTPQTGGESPESGERSGIVQQSLDVDVLEIEVPPAIVEHIEQSPPLMVEKGFLKEEQMEEIQEVLTLLERDFDLQIYVHILPSALYKQIYPQRALAVEKVKLLTSYGGIVALTEVPGERLVNFSNLLTTRLGAENLRIAIRQADEAADLAVGHEARIAAFITELLTQLTVRMEAEIPDSESSAVAIFDLLGRGTTEEPIEAAPEATTDALPSAEAGPDATEKSVTTAQAASGTAQQPAEAQPAVSGTVPEPEPRDSAEEGGFEGFLAGLLVGLLGMVGIAVFMNRQKLMGRRGRSQGSRRKSADEAAGKAPPVQVRPAALNKEKDEKEEEAREKLAALLEAERAKEQQLGGGKPEAEDPGDTPEQPDKRQS